MDYTSREYKQRKVDELRSIDLDSYPLVDGDEHRLVDYITEVRDNPDMHNLYEILAVLRFLSFMRKYEFRWNKVRKYTAFQESLKFDGNNGRRTYRLTPIQYFQFASIKGFYYWCDMGPAEPGDTAITKTRRIRDGRVEELIQLITRVILFLPRKFSKTTSMSSLAIFDLLGGDNNAQAYTAANSYRQAKICFDEISKVLQPLNPGKRYFKTTRETVKWKKDNPFGKDSFIECLSGGADAKDGLNASLVIFDEYAAAKYTKDHSDGAELLQVLESSMGTRREPLTAIITTASRVPDGPFVKELENAQATLRGEIENDNLFASLFMPDAWDGPDRYGDPDLWHKVNPHIGITVRENFYRDWWKKAQTEAEKMLEFKTKLLNVFTSASIQEWKTTEDIKRLQQPFDPRSFANRPPTMVSLDLSVHDDFSAMAFTSYQSDEAKFWVYIKFYIPEETLLNHPNRQLYQMWADAGHLTICPGKVISDDMIVNDLLEMNQHLYILQIGYDSYKAQEIINALGAAIASQGADPNNVLHAVPQTYGAFTSAVDSFDMAVHSDPPAIVFCDNPIIPYCFANCYLDEDSRTGNRKPLKRKANSKIDGAIVTLMNLWLFNNYERPM